LEAEIGRLARGANPIPALHRRRRLGLSSAIDPQSPDVQNSLVAGKNAGNFADSTVF
jgi:hypothetical protein